MFTREWIYLSTPRKLLVTLFVSFLDAATHLVGLISSKNFHDGKDGNALVTELAYTGIRKEKDFLS